MKKLIALTTAVALLIAPTTITALADEQIAGEYPKNFLETLAFSSLNDFATDGEKFAFADGTNLYVYQTESIDAGVYYGDLSVYSHTCAIESVALDDGLYFKGSDGVCYLYGQTMATCEYTFATTTTIATEGYIYNLVGENLGAFDLATNQSHTILGEFKSIKKVGESVFALADGGVAVLEGVDRGDLRFTYTDYSPTKNIATGDVFDKINDGYTLAFASLLEGATISAVDLDGENSSVFAVGDTVVPATGTAVLVIYKTANLAIVAIGDKAYLTHPDYLNDLATGQTENDMPSGYALADVMAYSSPFMSTATEVATLKKGAQVTVKEKISHGALFRDFYFVEFQTENGTASGYVPAPNLSVYAFEGENNKENIIAGPQSYETNVETVILVMILVTLVIMTIAYLTIVGTKPSKKKKKEKEITANAEE